MTQGVKLAYQAEYLVDNKELPPIVLGKQASYAWRDDPKHLLFSLARYKFCAKLLAGKERVLEVGCGDGTGAPILLQEIKTLHGIDIEPITIENCNQLNRFKERCTFETLDAVEHAPSATFDALISLDVIEHIQADKEEQFLKNIFSCLEKHGVAIIGTPNITAAQYASKLSLAGHINLKSHATLVASMKQFFHNVFLFSMNDELVHTGYYPMAHYLMALGTDKK